MAQFAVIGLGRFGITVAETLTQKGAEVIAIDNEEKKVEDVRNFVTNSICLDSTDEQALKAANINNVDAVILAIGGNKEVSILTAAILRKIGVGRIIAKVDSVLHARILKIMGVQRTIFPEQYVGREIANLLVSQHIFTYMEISKDHSLVEIAIPSFFVGKSLKELDVRNKYNVGIIAIKSSKPSVDEDGNNIVKEETNVIPSANDILNEEDKILIVGKKTDIDKLIKMSEKKVRKI
ncbi:MAG: TrkA family potassium uptake protein [Candidatus Cloacimonetes bacterium]|nr:TrkA family potassium uptake protein [Candidatus Cloacimonadota bacterium]